VTALVAAAVLLYVGFWMHDKAYAERWRAFIQSQLHEALSSRTMWALALVSFLAVYREAFETMLFYQALWVQVASHHLPVLGGFVCVATTLAILGWLIFRGSVRLPPGLFFGATSWSVFIHALYSQGDAMKDWRASLTWLFWPRYTSSCSRDRRKEGKGPEFLTTLTQAYATLLAIVIQGGLVMIPLLASSVIALTVIVEDDH
jgi:FTR1 family protein